MKDTPSGWTCWRARSTLACPASWRVAGSCALTRAELPLIMAGERVLTCAGRVGRRRITAYATLPPPCRRPDIWDREDLWVAIDRAMLNPPKKVKPNADGFIHWDVDTALRPLPIGVQGVLSLSTQDREVGGFQCVPELFTNFDEWVKTQPADRDPMHPDVTGLDVVYVGLEPGDLLIFNSLLAHGVRPNRSDELVRIAQYVSMYPADWDDAAERQDRIRQWREMDHPHRDAFPGDPRDWEKQHAQTAVLTPLGEKLLGLTRW